MIHINNISIDEFKKDKTFVISDFDRTITKPGSMTCWNLFSCNKIVPPELYEKSNKLYKFYRQIELMGDISKFEKASYMEMWAIEELNLFKKYGISKSIYDRIINENDTMELRDDFITFVKRLNDLNIKIYIVSGGIYDVIYDTLKKNNILLDNVEIVSNNVSFEDNEISCFSSDIIHSCNKNMIDLPISDDETGLLFGDLDGDKLIGKNYNTVDIIFSDIINNNFNINLIGNSSFDDIGKLLIKKY